jgi:hypothetical protein
LFGIKTDYIKCLKSDNAYPGLLIVYNLRHLTSQLY